MSFLLYFRSLGLKIFIVKVPSDLKFYLPYLVFYLPLFSRLILLSVVPFPVFNARELFFHLFRKMPDGSKREFNLFLNLCDEECCHFIFRASGRWKRFKNPENVVYVIAIGILMPLFLNIVQINIERAIYLVQVELLHKVIT